MNAPLLESLAPSKGHVRPPGAPNHIVQFYESDAFLVERLSGFLMEGVLNGEPGIVIATPEHRQALAERIPARNGTSHHPGLVLLDATSILEKFMVDDFPDEALFRDTLEGILAELDPGNRPVRAFGEMVAILWGQGKSQAALQLEELWEKELSEKPIRLLCAYPLKTFYGPAQLPGFQSVCDRHVQVLPSESLSSPSLSPEERNRAVAVLQQKTLALEEQTSELQKQLGDLRQLHELSMRLASLPSLHETLARILEHALAVFGAKQGLLSLTAEDAAGPVSGASVGFPEDFIDRLRFVPADSGACGRCLAEARPVLVEDVEKDPGFQPWLEAAKAAGFRAVHSQPLLNRAGRVIGVLSVHFPVPHRPSPREIEFGSVYARLAADSIEQARLRFEARQELDQRRRTEKKLREHVQALEVLNRVGTRLAAERDLEKILQTILEGGLEITEAPFGAFLYFSRDDQGSETVRCVLSGVPGAASANVAIARHSPLASPLFEGRGIVRQDDAGFADGAHGLPRIRSYLAVPVASFSGEPFGGFILGHPEPAMFGERVEPILTNLASQASVAIDNANLHAALKEELRQRRQGEEASRQLAAIVRSSNDAIISKDLDSRVMTWNKAAEAIFGYSEEEMIGKPITLLIPPHLQDEETRIIASIRRGQTVKHFETVRRRKDGREINISLTVSPILDKDGRIIGASKIARDITERKKIEAALGESEKRFRAMADSAPLSVWMADASGNFLYLNRYRLEFTGRSMENQIRAGWLDLVHPEDLEACRQAYLKGIGSRAPFRLEYRLKRIDGIYRWMLDSASPRFSEHGAFLGYAGCGVDVTDMKSAEEQLRQSQKMEAIGRLAGGIAHDFNNLLTSINGFTDLALMQIDKGGQLGQYLTEVRKSGERAASLTHQLLAYSRKQILSPRPINLNAVVADVERMLSRLIGDDISVRTALHRDLGTVNADPGQIQQVLVNLVLNARDAMPSGGNITIETANVFLGESASSNHLIAPPGPYVMLAVRDTGTGMTPEVQTRLFEPFFTTKPVGKGTGLGLSSVYGIVKQSGGGIAVESAIGRGTAFKIFLPLVEGGTLEAPKPPQSEVSAASASGLTLLVAEDETAVRRYLVEILKQQGYSVLEAGDGAQALAIGRDIQKLDLLLTDVVMPGLHGGKLAEELRNVHPGLRVIFMSGYARDILSAENLSASGSCFLQKPFAHGELFRRIEELASPAAKQ